MTWLQPTVGTFELGWRQVAAMLVRDAEDAGEIGLECPSRRFPDRGQWSCGAWQTTTERLAAVIADDPAPMRWAYPPAVELLTAEARYDGISHCQPELSDYIDMSSLGLTDRGQIREMAVTITAPPQLDPDERKA